MKLKKEEDKNLGSNSRRNLVRISFLILFNIGLGAYLDSIFSLKDNFVFHIIFWFIVACFGNIILIKMTEEKK